MRHTILAVLLLSAGACCPKGQKNQPGMFGGVNCVQEPAKIAATENNCARVFDCDSFNNCRDAWTPQGCEKKIKIIEGSR